MKNKKGFTLIELLIVVAIIGIIAAIAIPNLLTALNTSRQRATTGDMKTMGSGIEMYIVENGKPFPSNGEEIKVAIDNAITNVQSRNFFFKRIIEKDGWGNFLMYHAEADVYSVLCKGKAGSASMPTLTDGQPVEYVVNKATDYNNAIVFSNGNFTYGPKTRN